MNGILPPSWARREFSFFCRRQQKEEEKGGKRGKEWMEEEGKEVRKETK